MSHLVIFPSDEEIAFGLASGFSLVDKFGRHTGDDGNGIDTADAATDVVGGIATGLYTGFPTGAAENFEVSSDNINDDVGGSGAQQVRIHYLATSGSTSYSTVDVNLDGTTWVNAGVSGIRANRFEILGANDNVGKITVRHVTTTTNIFGHILPGRNQSLIAAYTVPAGHTGILKHPFVSVALLSGAGGSADVTIRVANTGGVLRTKREIDLTTDQNHGNPMIVNLAALDDIIIRCEDVSDNNTFISAGFRVILKAD